MCETKEDARSTPPVATASPATRTPEFPVAMLSQSPGITRPASDVGTAPRPRWDLAIGGTSATIALLALFANYTLQVSSKPDRTELRIVDEHLSDIGKTVHDLEIAVARETERLKIVDKVPELVELVHTCSQQLQSLQAEVDKLRANELGRGPAESSQRGSQVP